ncbi:unnamed protein product [Malus baccata var. baccata]
MSEEKHHRGLFHHHKDEDKPLNYPQPGYSDEGLEKPGDGRYSETTAAYGSTTTHESELDYKKEEKHHKHLKHFGKVGVKHNEKKDPEHAHKHKIEEGIVAAAAVGSGGFAFHEHHEKKETKEEEEEAYGKKKHHHF